MNIIAPHARVKSIVWENFGGKRGKVWTRNEAIRNCREIREEIAHKAALSEYIQGLKGKTVQKTANVRKVKGGYRAIGFGILNMDKTELYNHLKANGYSRVRMGGLVFNIK